jgi:putative hydrolase of the HAD superfamily
MPSTQNPKLKTQNSKCLNTMFIRVVTFDAAGTIIRLVDPPGRTYAKTARLFGYDLDPRRVQDAFRIAWKTLPPPPESAGPQPDDDRNWWRRLVSNTICSAGYEIDRFDDYFTELYETFARPGVWELFPDVPLVLTSLSRLGIRLGVISNFDCRLYDVLRHLGVRDAFEHVIVSSQVGAQKPAARIFLEAARRFGVAVDEILHIGDDPESDFAGARLAGLHALLVDHDTARLSGLFSCLSDLDGPGAASTRAPPP